MKAIEKELDRLVQMLHLDRRCAICGCPAEAVHHVVGRSNRLLRYALMNLVPVCYFCHRRIHDGKVDIEDYLKPGVMEKLESYKQKSYKDMLLFELRLSEGEWFKECKKALKESILR